MSRRGKSSLLGLAVIVVVFVVRNKFWMKAGEGPLGASKVIFLDLGATYNGLFHLRTFNKVRICALFCMNAILPKMFTKKSKEAIYNATVSIFRRNVSSVQSNTCIILNARFEPTTRKAAV